MPYRPRHNSMIRAFLLGLLASLFFALLGGVVVYHDTPPDAAGFVGLGIVVLGLVMNSLSTAAMPARRELPLRPAAWKST